MSSVDVFVEIVSKLVYTNTTLLNSLELVNPHLGISLVTYFIVFLELDTFNRISLHHFLHTLQGHERIGIQSLIFPKLGRKHTDKDNGHQNPIEEWQKVTNLLIDLFEIG